MSLIGIQRNTHSNTQTGKETTLVQRAKNIVCDSPGLVDFAIGLVNSVLNLPEGQVRFLRNSNYRRFVKSLLLTQKFVGLAEITFWLVNANVASACSNGKP